MPAVDYAAKYQSARSAVLALLSDKEWHDWRALADVAGVRYCARVDELVADGFVIESQQLADDGKRYRLVDVTGKRRTRRVRLYLTSDDARELAAGRVTMFAQHEARRATKGKR